MKNKEREDSENPEWVDDMYYDQQWREERKKDLVSMRRILIIGIVIVSLIIVGIWLW